MDVASKRKGRMVGCHGLTLSFCVRHCQELFNPRSEKLERTRVFLHVHLLTDLLLLRDPTLTHTEGVSTADRYPGLRESEGSFSARRFFHSSQEYLARF